jgi:hypothetical protein
MALTKFRVRGSTALVEATLACRLLPDESQSSFDDLQAWNDGVQVHPVDGLDLQSDVLAQHLGDGLW